MAQYNPYGQQYYQSASATPSSPGAYPPQPATAAYPATPQAGQQYYQQQQAQQYYNGYPPQQQYTHPVGYPSNYGYGSPQPPRQMMSQPIPNADTGSIWMGDVEPWMDESFLSSLFAHTNESFSVKVIKDKNTGQNANFCFVNFVNPIAAQKVIENFNGHPIPNTNKVFRLNWAAYGMQGKSRKPGMPSMGVPGRPPIGDQANDCSLFVGDLAQDVTDYYLMTTFQYYYPSCYSAKVVMDPKTNVPKGFGFVYFTDEGEKMRALNEMQGYYLSYRPIRLNLATKKGESRPGVYSTDVSPTVNAALAAAEFQNSDPNITTVFVGNLDPSIVSEQLYEIFAPFGEIKALKMPHGKLVAFVEYALHSCALKALTTLGYPNLGTIHVNGFPLKISWGKPAKPLPPGAVTTPPAGAMPGMPWPKSYPVVNYLPPQPLANNAQQPTENQQQDQTEAPTEAPSEENEQKEEEKPVEIVTTNEEANLAPSLEEQEEQEKRKPEEEAEEQVPNKKRRVEGEDKKEEKTETKEGKTERKEAVLDPNLSTNQDSKANEAKDTTEKESKLSEA